MTANSDLLCPRCNVPLEEVRTSHGVFWTCENCAGRALTVKLLRRTFMPESINPLWLHAISGKGKSGRLCPSCRNQCSRWRCPGARRSLWMFASIVISSGSMPHEMDTLAPRLPPASAVELPQKAREFIAIERVNRSPKKRAAPISTARRRMKHGNKSQASLDYRSNSKHRKRSENHGQPGYFSRQSFAVSLLAFPRLRAVVQRFGLIPAQATQLDGLPFVTSSSFAHLGGAAVGVVTWLIWRKEKPNDEARMTNVEGNDGIRMTK